MSAPAPRLSLILCARNDAYLGNSLWRLETTLNYTADRVRALGLDREVEIIVSDWGSEVPLATVVKLGAAASPLVSFLHVPPQLARDLQHDSPFAEVIALNAAARRARGQFIGRIDQDTLTGERFLAWIANPPEGAETTLFFANRRSIPYRFAVLCPRLDVVERFVGVFGRRLRIETGRVFYHIDVGIWLAHRDLWHECGGYDERMIYMNDMDIDMVDRLRSTYPLVDLGKVVDYDFYHLDHYHPGGSRSSSTHRKVNSQRPVLPIGVRPSGEGWGLASASLMLAQGRAAESVAQARNIWPSVAVLTAMSISTGVRVVVDRALYPFFPRWKQRASIAWATVRREPVLRWPWLLKRLWIERPSASRVVMR